MHRIALAIAVAVLAHAAPAIAAAPLPVERTLYTDAPNGMFLLDQGWSTRADPNDEGVQAGWWQPGTIAGFTPTSIPNAFNAGDLSQASFDGGVQWYRTTFAAPDLAGVAQWRVRFESVNTDATVWLNGTQIGSHRGAYLPFELDAVLRPGDNELVVRVDSRGNAGDLPPANRPRGWWNFGGILREVYLRAVRSFDLSSLQVTATPGTPATAHIRATLQNTTASPLPAPVTLRLQGPQTDRTATVDPGTIGPGESKAINATLDISSPRLWSPRGPTLYKLTADAPGGQRTIAHFGIRKWSVDKDGRLRLNGKRLILRGASFHEQTAATGAALTPEDRTELVRELQAIGANVARQHYPPHPALLEAFDRAGIVFWEQIPVWRVRGTQLKSASFRATALAALRDAVLRDRNHASVVAWSISNETLGGASGERTYFKAARSLLNRLDPTRLLAADKSLRPLRDLPRTYRLVDAIGLNEYVGWYGGQTSELPAQLATVRRRFPHQALVITEFGAEANRTGSSRSKGSYAFQRNYVAAHLRLFDRTRFLSGALVWALRDFAARPGWTGGNPHPQPPILFKGLFNQGGTPKPAAATVRRIFKQG